jgi:hypothetical protein
MEVQMKEHGEELVRFADSASHPHSMEWTMTFTQQGKLIKASHSPASMITANPLPEKSAVAKSWPVPQSPEN